ncbi:unnamed protein product [Owenia fusiformis]|uniref:Uncharacterized protein n=1 Tax=Owenia fusiformis TaxID=6347 RepID=A0A8J1TU07_OWEFU|nr:unnamed protein product [Owenia fusiformis]
MAGINRVVLCVSVFLTQVHSNGVQHMNQGNSAIIHAISPNDKGKLEGCDGTKLTGSWSPKALSSGASINVALSLIPMADFQEGVGTLNVWIPNQPNPIIRQKLNLNCMDLQKYLPVACPLQKGKKYNDTRTFTVPSPFLPAGTYKLKLLVHNEHDDEVACVEIPQITINDNYDYDDDPNYEDYY